ncbi:alpha/beta hydrolase [Metabacillus endolithicus]|uniref:Alpha/beta hydrolase n=1 Tax=Metabacillus endolithicus TaxID=1535204 RepID=A0ABW5BS95_9BACI|nr:alpha/beta hydrolase [Metabacillus endolithicus]UPG63620.1 alpha/beta hydrolase [Metabacillus endolithicus]
MKSIIKKTAIIFSIFIIISLLGLWIWSQQTYKPSEQLFQLVEPTSIIYKEDWIVFQPQNDPVAGLIIYPGAKVEPEAYSYLGKQLSLEGYVVFIPEFTFNFPILDSNKAQEIITHYPEIKHWFVGGHSLGGVSAAMFAQNHIKELTGLILLGSYPSNEDRFSSVDFPILSIYGEKDGLTTVDKIKETEELLSTNAQLVEIQGGNHSQFGIYGFQKGDHKATISAKNQQQQIIDIISKWLGDTLNE